MGDDRKLYTAIAVLGVLILSLALYESFRPAVPQGGGAEGARCGGFIMGAPACAPGFHCRLEIANPDAGGTCVADVPAATSYEDATYVIDGETVALAHGVSEIPVAPGSASMRVVRIFGNEATGDLDGDGDSDVAFILTEDGGGSGLFYYVAAALKTQSGYQGTNAMILGDRIAPQPTEIKSGIITVNYADRAKGEPMTATPSVGVSRSYRIQNGALVRVAK